MRDAWLGFAVLLLVAIGVPGSAEDVHGDSPLTAFPIDADGHLVAACIDDAGDMDFFLFAAQAGRRYILQTRRSSPEMEAVLFLFASDGQGILEVGAAAADGSDARIEWQCPQTGTYFAMVRHALSTTGTGCYELSVGAVQVDDHGDDPLSATPLTTTGAPLAGYLETQADVDVFLLQAKAGYDYTVTVANLIGGVMPILSLIAPDGQTAIVEAAASPGVEDVRLVWTAELTGAHFLMLRGASGASIGGYDVSASQTGYGDDHANTWSDATPVAAGGSATGGRIEVPGDVDVFAVAVREGGEYTIVVRPSNGDGQLAAALLASDGSSRLATAVPVGQGAVEIDWVSSATSTCYVEVQALATGTGAYTVSVQSVLQLDLIGHFNPQGGYTLDVAVVDDLAFLIVGSKGLLIVDVSDPAEPQELGSYSTPGYSQALAVDGRHLFMANRGDGISILDVSDEARPVELGRYDTMGSAQDIAVVGSLAFVADQRGGLVMLGIANPSRPEFIGSWATRGYAEGVAVAKDIAYVATGDVGLEIVDVADPTTPTLLSELDLTGEAHSVVAFGEIVYVAAGYRGLRVIDVSDPTQPVELDSVGTAGEAHGLFRVGSYLYVADYTEGLAVFSLLDPTAPQLMARVDTPGYAVNVFVSDQRAYVADRENGLRILSVLP